MVSSFPRFQSDPFFAFHCINAFDDADGSVVLDIACYPNIEARDTTFLSWLISHTLQILDYLKLSNLRNLGTKLMETHFCPSAARRYRLTGLPESLPAMQNPSGYAEAILEFDLGSMDNVELPVTSPHVANKPYQYAYGVHYHRNSEDEPIKSLANSIIKLDVKNRTSKKWVCENQAPGEPIFVPKPEGSQEDSGILLTVVLDGEKGTSALVVLDAETMQEVARAEMKIPVPYGFHVSEGIPRSL